ncbi:MAG: ARMT1-like domain-containing protein [Candidatus Bathyarchaeia archaeon]
MMKVAAKCLPCIVERGYKEASYVTEDQNLLLDVMVKLSKMVGSEYSANAIPAHIGTLRDRIVKETLGRDPYVELKKLANERALKLLPTVEDLVEKTSLKSERFKIACSISVVANSVEFDVAGYNFKFENLETALKIPSLTIDQTLEAFTRAETARRVLFLTDNAGEIVLDIPLMRVLKSLGATLTVAVKGAPVLNDATLNEALEVGVDKNADELITTGTDGVGFMFDEVSEEARMSFLEADLVVAKGMGNYETLTELEGCGKQVLFLLKAKCLPVARSLGVVRGSNVALLRKL